MTPWVGWAPTLLAVDAVEVVSKIAGTIAVLGALGVSIFAARRGQSRDDKKLSIETSTGQSELALKFQEFLQSSKASENTQFREQADAIIAHFQQLNDERKEFFDEIRRELEVRLEEAKASLERRDRENVALTLELRQERAKAEEYRIATSAELTSLREQVQTLTDAIASLQGENPDV